MAIFLMLLASGCFVSMAALVKLLGDSLPLTVMMLLRTALALPLLFAVVLHHKQTFFTRAPVSLFFRTIFGAAAMFCFYYALTNMPLAECVFIGRLQPLLLALLAPFIVRESPPPITWLAIITGILGAALIMQPAMAWRLAALAAFGGALFSAIAHLMVRRLNRVDDPAVIVLNFTFFLALISLVPALPVWKTPSLMEWLLLTGVAFFATSGQYLLTKAYQLDQAPVVAAASYSSVVLSLIYGYFFWNETPDLSALIGGLFIILGGILLFWFRHDKAQHARSSF
jgi:drug/metabolite transporter (DMT)-like permease